MVERQVKVFIKKLALFLSVSQQALSADIPKNSKIQLLVILCNICNMNIEINIFTVLEKDLKNVSERKLPI
jgi:hypothetical protein